MAHLPPVTWNDVATKDDIGVLGADLRTEIAGLRTDFAQGMERQTRWIVTFNTALAALALTAARLLF